MRLNVLHAASALALLLAAATTWAATGTWATIPADSGGKVGSTAKPSVRSRSPLGISSARTARRRRESALSTGPLRALSTLPASETPRMLSRFSIKSAHASSRVIMRLHRVVSCLLVLAILPVPSIAYSTSGTWSQIHNATRLHPISSATYPLREHAAVYDHDPIQPRVLAFGGVVPPGFLGPYTNELWGLELSYPNPFWRQLTTIGMGPNPRARASMVYDPETDRTLIFGGYNPGGLNGLLWQVQSDPYPATSVVWSQLNDSLTGRPSGSTANIDVRAVLDTARRRLLVISPTQGVYGIGLSGGAWSQIYSGPLDDYKIGRASCRERV